MGFLSGPGMAGAAGGANQALQNFLQFYMQNKELSQRKKLEEDRLAEQKLSRQATEGYHTGMMGISQSRENRELRAAEDAATQALQERMAVQPMPQYPAVPQGMTGGPEAYPETPGPMGDMDQIRALMQANPGKYAGTFGQLIKQKDPSLITGVDDAGNPIRVADAPGVTPYEKDKPSIPLYKEISISPDQEQDFMWNRTTKQHDIPIGKPRPIGAKSPKVNVTTKVGADSMSELGKEMSKALVTERKDVEGAASALRNIQEAEKLLDSGVITGTGADYLVGVGNFLSSRLGFNQASDPVANTQAYAATMGNQVGQIIKQFGAGTGLSDADREYAEKIVGGKITLTEQALRKLIAINKRAFTNVVEGFNKRAEHAMTRPGAELLPYDLRVDIGTKRPPMEIDYNAIDAELRRRKGK